MFAVLKNWHPMIGRDMHFPWPPMSPAPAPAPVPYFTSAPMFGYTAGTTTQAYFLTHLTEVGGLTMARMTDIGPMIPHVGPPSITMVIEFLLSWSKSYFGVSTYQGIDNRGMPNCVAVALLGFANLNVNCIVPPLSIGTVVAPNTHVAMMSLGDFFGGVLTAGMEMVLQLATGKIAGLGGKLAKSVAGRLGFRYFASKAAAKAFLRAAGNTKGNVINDAARALVARSRPGARLFEPIGTAVLGLAVGAPQGTDLATFDQPTMYGAVHDYFDPPPPKADPTEPPAVPTIPEYGVQPDGGGPGSTDAGVPRDADQPSGGTPPPPDVSAGAPDGGAPTPSPSPSDAGAPSPSDAGVPPPDGDPDGGQD
jgi:hypothetical protein